MLEISDFKGKFAGSNPGKLFTNLIVLV